MSPTEKQIKEYIKKAKEKASKDQEGKS